MKTFTFEYDNGQEVMLITCEVTDYISTQPVNTFDSDWDYQGSVDIEWDLVDNDSNVELTDNDLMKIESVLIDKMGNI